MSFSYKFKTLTGRNIYDSSAQLEMSEEEVTGEVEVDASGGNEENSVRFSPDLVDERIKVSLEPLIAQISTFIEWMDFLIQGNSAREFTTASIRDIRHQSESLFSGAPGSSRFPAFAPLTW